MLFIWLHVIIALKYDELCRNAVLAACVLINEVMGAGR